MTKKLIFPFSRRPSASLAAALATTTFTLAAFAAGPAPGTNDSALAEPAALEAQDIDPDADLKAQKLPHQENITMIEYERRAWQRDLARREDQCLKRFFSSGCIDDLRKEHLREMRDYDLRKEAELQAIRDIDAEVRQRVRARKALEAGARSSTEKPAKPAKPDSKGQP